MERNILYKKQIIEDMELDYYIIADDISKEYCNLETYGVRIIKTVCSEGGGKSIESNQINNIFYRKCDIESFMELIVRNSVTPMSLKDVVEDYIAESMTVV